MAEYEVGLPQRITAGQTSVSPIPSPFPVQMSHLPQITIITISLTFSCILD
jgi:hypothetical protein